MVDMDRAHFQGARLEVLAALLDLPGGPRPE
jgi:hypothetical protein